MADIFETRADEKRKRPVGEDPLPDSSAGPSASSTVNKEGVVESGGLAQANAEATGEGGMSDESGESVNRKTNTEASRTTGGGDTRPSSNAKSTAD